MTHPRFQSSVLLRGFTILVAAAIGWAATGLGEGTDVLRGVLIVHVLYFGVSSALARRQYGTPPVPFILLAGDLLALGAVGCWLHSGLEPQIAFLAGYLVSVLVAVMGRSVTAAVLGTLAGTMVVGLTAALFSVMRAQPVDMGLLGYQVGLLATAGVLSALVMGWMDEEMRRHQLNERLQREIQQREAEAAEVMTFTQALAASGCLAEVLEAILRHLRAHLDVQARAVALEIRGEGAALWEEDGRLTDDHTERRRCLLQEALVRVGSTFAITRLTPRSVGGRPLPPLSSLQTAVEVPIRAGGRVAGVLFVGDARRAALEDRQIGTLADAARRVGEAIQRIERQGDEETRRTALLLRQMREGVVLLGADGRVLLANPAAREALRCPGAQTPLPESIGHLPRTELARTPSGVSRRFRAQVEDPETGKRSELACTAVGILDGTKRLGTLVTLSDVTEEEMARDRLVKSEKMTLVGQTLAGVAHELNNPLTALVGYADLLLERNVPEDVQRSLGKIREQAFRATRIVKNLLSVARRRNPERTPTTLRALVDPVVELFAYEARLTRIRIDVDVPGDLPEVLADKHAMQQVFINLVQNAIHALQEWEGERWIRIQGRNLPDGLAITVADSGPGIAESLRTRVFHPFFTTKGSKSGTGLGLAISRSITREHGGDLILDQGDGGGARFIVRLPVVAPAGQREGGTAGAAPADVPRRILVVDDEQDVRESLVAQLGRMGCWVDSTNTGEEALRMAAVEDYDVLLVDLRMPGMTGLELRTALLERIPELAPRVVFMSGDYTNEELLRDVKATGNRFLEKPFTSEELLGALSAPEEGPGGEANGASAPRAPTPGGARVKRLSSR